MNRSSTSIVRAAALSVLLLLPGCSGSGSVSPTGPPDIADTTSPPPGAPSPGTSATARPKPESPSPTPLRTTAAKTATCPGGECLTVVLTGDLLLHEGLWEQAAVDGGGQLDFGPMLAAQEEYIAPADFAICHQETPLAEPGGPYSGFPAFNVPPQIADAVANLGYDACTTASNHTLDAGTAGLNRTLDTLDTAGLEHTGSYRTAAEAAEPLIVDTGEARIAVITGTYALNGIVPEFGWQVDQLDPAVMIAKADEAREAGADVVLAAVHAGDEYADYANAQQQEVAHALVDSGRFDLVYGHHSHSVLPIEKYNGVWIVYGLGNTIAAHLTPDIRNTEGLLVEVSFEQDDDGGWQGAGIRWLPATWNGPAHRWCPVAAVNLEEMAALGTSCVSTEADAASRQRSKVTVESMGAADAGAVEWQGQ
ncbi:CapA family protein [Arthrobacter sp. EH-1B-1]|uniref:CapA family protein n=1 Tax=Arthrobacter vasquezii TaxID=2977629 RepID=A0ABT6CWJ3_9MICC|nr:CapA family protein [Arthrobacter vasquezii]MDF9277872.1 CapA family protein [Arthrobacter vasquezii]